MARRRVREVGERSKYLLDDIDDLSVVGESDEVDHNACTSKVSIASRGNGKIDEPAP